MLKGIPMRVAVVMIATTVINVKPEEYKEVYQSIPSVEDAVQMLLENVRDNPVEFLENQKVSVDVHIQEIQD